MTVKSLTEKPQQKKLLTFTYFFLIIMACYLIKPVRSSLVITYIGSAQLPYLYILSAVVLGGLIAWYTRVVRHIAPQRLMPAILGMMAIQLVAFRYALQLPYAWISGLFYLWVSMFSVVTVTQFWAVANDLFSPNEAKSAFAFIGTGGLIGGIAGSVLTSLLVRWVQTEDLLIVAAGLLGLCTVLLGVILRSHHTNSLHTTVKVQDVQTSVNPHKSLLGYLKEFRYLRYLLVLVMVAKATSTIIDYQFNGLVELLVSGKEARTALFGTFYTGLNLASLIVQLLLTSQLLKRFGVHRTLAVLPVGLAAGLVSLLLVPGIAVIALVAMYDRSLSYSLGQTSKEVLYVPIPSQIRYQVKPLIDAAAFRFAQGMAGVGILLAQHVGHLPIQAFSFLALPLVGIWLMAIHQIRNVQPNSIS